MSAPAHIPMHFCAVCGRAMARNATSGAVVFRCACGEEIPGTPADARVGGETLDTTSTIEMYRRLIRTASADRTNQLVARPCPECGLDYMAQIRVGDAEVIVYTCKCGHEEGNEGTAAAPAAAPSLA